MTQKLNNLSPCPLPLQVQGRGDRISERGFPSFRYLTEEMETGSPRGTESLFHNLSPLSFEGVVKESQREVKPLFYNYFPLSFEGEGD